MVNKPCLRTDSDRPCSGALVRALRSTMGNKTWLSLQPRNLDCSKIVRLYAHPFMLTDLKCHNLC